jgi:hypothetical protein
MCPCKRKQKRSAKEIYPKGYTLLAFFLVELGDGSLFGYLTWTDNRDVVPGTDPREAVQDGFDVNMCVAQLSDGTFGPNTCPNSGGLDQNIYGNTITIP